MNELVQVLNKKLIDVVLNLEEIPKEYKEYKNLVNPLKTIDILFIIC